MNTRHTVRYVVAALQPWSFDPQLPVPFPVSVSGPQGSVGYYAVFDDPDAADAFNAEVGGQVFTVTASTTVLSEKGDDVDRG